MATLRTLRQLRTYEVALGREFGPVAGVDEAGRGACAGPIAIAACILPPHPIAELADLNDSKKLTERTRERLFPLIKKHASSYSVVLISAADIDRYGIQHANVSGMRRAIAQLDRRPGFILTDALPVPGLPAPSLPLIGGDRSARCIAAASVLAKVTRDQHMVHLDGRYPGYGFAEHKGYGTASHVHAVRHQGGSPEHRYTYANIARAHQAWLDQQIPEKDQ